MDGASGALVTPHNYFGLNASFRCGGVSENPHIRTIVDLLIFLYCRHTEALLKLWAHCPSQFYSLHMLLCGYTCSFGFDFAIFNSHIHLLNTSVIDLLFVAIFL